MLLFVRCAFPLLAECGGIEHEEVPAQQNRDTKQHLGIDTIAVEDAVAGHTVRAELLAQPGHRAPRAVHLLTYRLPYVDLVCHRRRVARRPFPKADKNGVKPSAYIYYQALVNLHNI